MLALRIGVPRQLLQGGIVIVDTPGVGGLGTAHHSATLGALPSADAVVFVSDVSQELTASEVEFLRTVKSLCPTVLCVESKTDFYPAWQRIVARDRQHIATAGIEAEVLPISSTLQLVANARRIAPCTASLGTPTSWRSSATEWPPTSSARLTSGSTMKCR